MNHVFRMDTFNPLDNRLAQLINFPSATVGARSQAEASTYAYPRSERQRCHLEESLTEYSLSLALPGVAPASIEITVDSNRLSVILKRTEEDAGNWLATAYQDAENGRTFALPEDARADDITAKLDRGVMTINIPRHQKPKPRKIALEH